MAEAVNMVGHDPQSPAEWRDHIQTYGYVIVHDALPQENLQAVIDDIWKHTGADPNDPDSWYSRPEIIRPGGMVEMYQYQSLWNNRQNPKLYDIFRAIHGTDKLWVSMDRVGFKPPVNPRHPDFDHKGMIHWDTDITKYPDIPFHVQGVVALTDTEPDMGGFQCIPETYQHLDEYLKTQTPEKLASRNPDYTGYTITKPRLRAGDILIWTSLLLHGNGHNVSTRPRLCQYLSMNPTPADAVEAREPRVEAWEEHRAPGWGSFKGDPRKIEETQGHQADLTELGRHLLGVDLWG